jgi:hydrogenase maturation protease
VTTRVIGVGVELRGDDAAGLLVARRLGGRVGPDVEVIETDGEVARLLELLEGAGRVVLADAARDGLPPGTVRRLDPASVGVPVRSSTHGLGVAEALGLAAAMGRPPRQVSVYSISGGRFEPGPATPAVRAGARAAAARILDELDG